MSPMPRDPFSAVPEGMRWCPHCNGYGSSLKEDAERCTHCAGTGLVVDEAAAVSAEPRGDGSASGGEPRGD
jgi:DnaJ-class molecular chaperone